MNRGWLAAAGTVLLIAMTVVVLVLVGLKSAGF